MGLMRRELNSRFYSQRDKFQEASGKAREHEL
jgi:hypothetical protein